MKEMIVVAGKSDLDIEKLRNGLATQDYDSILCNTVKELIEELKVLPLCGVRVLSIIIDKEMLINTSQDLITELGDYSSNVPFVLFDKANTLPSAEELLSGSMQHLTTTTGSELSECFFGIQCMKILEFARAELSDLDCSTSDTQTILTLTCAAIEIADLATQMVEPEVKALAEKAADLLEDIQLNKGCVMSDAHREFLLTLMNDIERHALKCHKTLKISN